jgi:hypothetical protein
MDFWWIDRTKQYEEGTQFGPKKESPMLEFTPSVPKMLNDLGTRFRMLNDFQDYLGDGLVAVQNSLARYDNESDQKRKDSLEGALKLLNVYMGNLAQYDQHKFELNKLLDEHVPSKAVMDAIKAERAAVAKITKDAIKEGPQEPPIAG